MSNDQEKSRHEQILDTTGAAATIEELHLLYGHENLRERILRIADHFHQQADNYTKFAFGLKDEKMTVDQAIKEGIILTPSNNVPDSETT